MRGMAESARPRAGVAHRHHPCSHGVPMVGEYPYLYHHGGPTDAGQDGETVLGMTACVERRVDAESEGGHEGGAPGRQVPAT